MASTKLAKAKSDLATAAELKLSSGFWALPEEWQKETIGGMEASEMHAEVVKALLDDTGLEATALAMMMVERYASLYIYTRIRESYGIGKKSDDPTEESAGASKGFKEERNYKETLQQLNNQAVGLQKVAYSVDEGAIKDAVLDKVDDHIEVAVANLPSEWQKKVRSAIDLELKQAEF